MMILNEKLKVKSASYMKEFPYDQERYKTEASEGSLQ